MLNRDLRVYLVNQQNHVPDWKASHSFFMRYMYIQTVNFIMAIWAFPCEIYLFATNICEISDSIANFEKRKKIWFSYLNHPQSRWTVWKSQGGWESKEVSIISPLVEMGLIHMPKSRGGALCVEMGFYTDISWESRCIIEINVWTHFYEIFLVLEVLYKPKVQEMPGKSWNYQNFV